MYLGDTDKYPKVLVLEVMQLTQTDHIELHVPSQVEETLSGCPVEQCTFICRFHIILVGNVSYPIYPLSDVLRTM